MVHKHTSNGTLTPRYYSDIFLFLKFEFLHFPINKVHQDIICCAQREKQFNACLSFSWCDLPRFFTPPAPQKAWTPPPPTISPLLIVHLVIPFNFPNLPTLKKENFKNKQRSSHEQYHVKCILYVKMWLAFVTLRESGLHLSVWYYL